jgi:D-glycero-alpha-D-manno-heptose-7-phosphate kinase
MIISRTPFRISFFGGGTDYPKWYRSNGGAVLATTIDKYCYLTCRYLPPFFEHRIRVVYSVIENCRSVDEIQHPAVRECLRFVKMERGVEIHHDGDLPARGGMGSSSAFTVGLLHALYALSGRMPSKEQLAIDSITVEQERIEEAVGSQDQVSAAYGGFNTISFKPDGRFHVRPMTLSHDRVEELNANLMLFYTGIQRTAATIAKSVVNAIPSPTSERTLRAARAMVDEAVAILSGGGDLAKFGLLLHEAWLAKRSLSAAVSNSKVERIYEAARDAGALGGKLTGAGGGGFMLLFVPPKRQEDVRHALRKLIHVPFKFESSGSEIILYDREQDYSREESVRDLQVIDGFHELPIDNAE